MLSRAAKSVVTVDRITPAWKNSWERAGSGGSEREEGEEREEERRDREKEEEERDGNGKERRRKSETGIKHVVKGIKGCVENLFIIVIVMHYLRQTVMNAWRSE